MILDSKCSQEYPLNAGVPQGSILGPTLFLVHTNYLPDDVICNITIHADDTTLYSKCDQVSDLWQQLDLWLLNLNLFCKTLWTEVRSGLLVSMIGKPI